EGTEEDFDWPEAATEYEEPEEVPAQPAEEDWLASIMASSEAASEQSESDVNEAAAETAPASSDEYAWLDAIRTDDDAEPEAESLGIEDVLPLAAGAGAVALSQFDDDDDALPHDESDEIETVGEPEEAAIEEPDSAEASEISAEEQM